jgi:circadian clock protein KaiC
LEINETGIVIGDPIRGFTGILSGTPALAATKGDLLSLDQDEAAPL